MGSKIEEELRELHTSKPLILQTSKSEKSEPEREHESNRIVLWIGILVACLMKTVSCWQMASILVTAIAPKEDEFWCARPTDQKNISSIYWINNTHIWDSEKNRWDKCQIWNLENESIACHEWEFMKEESIIEEWRLFCDNEILIAVQQFFYLFGIFTHGLINNIIMNKYSSRNVAFVAMLSQTVFGFLVSQSPNFILATTFRYLTALSCGFMFTAGLIIFSNTLGTRGSLIIAIPASYELFWSVGTLTLGPISTVMKNWRLVQLFISVPTIVLIVLSWALPKNQTPQITSPKIYYIPKKVKFLRIFLVHIAFSCTIIHFYGGLLNAKSWSPNLNNNIFIAGLAEFSGVIVGIIIMLKFKKKKWLLLGLLLALCGLPMVLCHNLPKQYFFNLTVIGFFGKFSIACSLVQMSTQMNEFFYGIKNTKTYIWSAIRTARFFLLSAPFINHLVIFNPFLPMIVHGSLLIVNSIAILILARIGLESSFEEGIK